MPNTGRKLKVLFLCTGNSCRSQMAEGWARALKPDTVEPFSAGIEVHGLNPKAVIVMAEAGVDISRQRSKHVRELLDMPFDCVVTVCDNARETCPTFPRPVARLHRTFDDPARYERELDDESLVIEQFRRVRDDIRRFVEAMPGNLPRADGEK